MPRVECKMRWPGLQATTGDASTYETAGMHRYVMHALYSLYSEQIRHRWLGYGIPIVSFVYESYDIGGS